MLPDGSVNPGEMTSFNHYALGAVADWMHRVVAGLGPGSPGYRSLRIEPRPGGRISWARTAHRTPYGLAEVAWERAEGELRVDVTVPTGSVATVVLPGLEPREIECGRHRFVVPHPSPPDDREWHPSPPFPLDEMLTEGER
jgi:alpha-L-rhamnosidase